MRPSWFLIGFSLTALLATVTEGWGQTSGQSSTSEAHTRELALEAVREIQAGRTDSGVELLHQALDLTVESDRQTVANLSSLLGGILIQNNQMEGLQYLQRTESLCRQVADRWEICAKNRQLLLFLQTIHPPEDRVAERALQATDIVDTGNYEAAVEPLKEALAEARRSGNLAAEAMLSALLGMILSTSDFAQSLKHLQRTEELCLEAPHRWSICSGVELMLVLIQESVGIEPSSDLPALMPKLGDPRLKGVARLLEHLINAKSDDEILDAMREMLRTANAAGEQEDQLYRQLEALLATSELLTRNEVLARISELRQILGRHAEHLLPGFSKHQLGKLAAAEGRLEEAEELLSEAYEEALGARVIFQQSHILNGLADVQWKRGKRSKARQTLEDSIRIDQARELELLLQSPLAVDLKQSFPRAIEKLIQYEAWSDLPQAAFDRADDLKARTLLARLGRQRPEASQANRRLLPQLQAKNRHLRDLEKALLSVAVNVREEVAEALETARREYIALLIRQRISASDDTVDSGDKPVSSLASLAELMPTLGDTAIVAFFATAKEVLIWVVDTERFEMVRVKLSKEELEERIRTFLNSVSRGRLARVQNSRGSQRLLQSSQVGATTDALYQLLIAPIRPLLHHSRLVLIPHGILHALPFSALRDPESGRYLSDEFTLGNAPSIKALARLTQQASKGGNGSALVVGNPTTSLGHLPGAEREAQSVAEVLDTRPLLKDEALESKVQSRLIAASWVHLAAHAVLQEESPFFSRLELTPDAGLEGHDGHLEIHEILTDLDLDNVELVVLSGCETALGETTPGDEIIGLGRAFLYAGSPAVVSTLWPVDDDASAKLMTHFYRELQSGKPVDQALQSAQKHLRNHPATQDPYFWAGYVAQGDTSRAWRGLSGNAQAPGG